MKNSDLQTGRRIKITDTFLVNCPFWTGEIIERTASNSIIIKWDDGEPDSTFAISDFYQENAQKTIELI